MVIIVARNLFLTLTAGEHFGRQHNKTYTTYHEA